MTYTPAPLRIEYTVPAHMTREAMKPQRRALLDRGLERLASDPYHPASAPVGTDENERKAQVAPGVLIEYVIAHAVLVIIVMTIFDESLIMDDEE